MQLFHKEYPGPGKPLIIMHGLFGMLDNWHNIARVLSAEFHVFLLDLRNHGQSPHSGTMNYSATSARGTPWSAASMTRIRRFSE